MKYIVNVDPRIQVKQDQLDLPVYIKFSGDVTEESGSKFCEEVRMAEECCVKSGQEVLPVVIDTYGGDVYALLGMVDMLQSLKVKVATIVEGKAMSCGAVLFSCGTEGYRFMGPNASVMIHEVSSYSHGKNEEIKSSAAESERLNNRIFALMGKNCGKSADYFINIGVGKRNADIYLSAEECVKHNLANHIGIPQYTVEVSMKQEFSLPGVNDMKRF